MRTAHVKNAVEPQCGKKQVLPGPKCEGQGWLHKEERLAIRPWP